MKIPQSPPEFNSLMQEIFQQGMEHFQFVIMQGGSPLHKRKYIHWDKLRHLTPPEGITLKEYWYLIKSARRNQYLPVPLYDKHEMHFQYMITTEMLDDLLWIEKNSSGSILMDGQDADSQMGKKYIYYSLIEEAINSSQLEGASTTRRVAKDMLSKNRPPRDKHEKMIFNNFHAMQFIKEIRDEELTPSIICEIHSILTEGTFNETDTGSEGQLRKKGDDICVFAPDETNLHIPPSADTLPERLQALCDFANKNSDEHKVPDVLKAIILHFMIGYDHPFIDGNGRTARALFYWYMAKKGYWLIEYISISRVIKRSLTKYMYAYLHTETDERDLTYFIIHQIEVIISSIQELHEYIKLKSRQIQNTRELLKKSKLHEQLNLRQIQIIEHSLKNPGEEYTIKQHQNEYRISYQTARTDLLDLSVKHKLLRKRKDGKRDVFSVPNDIEYRINNYPVDN